MRDVLSGNKGQKVLDEGLGNDESLCSFSRKL